MRTKEQQVAEIIMILIRHIKRQLYVRFRVQSLIHRVILLSGALLDPLRYSTRVYRPRIWPSKTNLRSVQWSVPLHMELGGVCSAFGGGPRRSSVRRLSLIHHHPSIIK